MLVCENAACIGCTTNSECPGAQLCDDGVCREIDTLPVCEQLAGHDCGNAVVEVLEDCDGATACDACRSTEPPEPWLDAEGLIRFVSLADGSAYALESRSLTGAASLRRYATDASETWSVPLTDEAFELAADPGGNAYLVGSRPIDGMPYGAPWLAAWDPDGTPLWSIEGVEQGAFMAVAADAKRVVVGGQLGPQNAEYGAVLRQHGLDGEVAWTMEDSSLFSIEGVALVGTETAATAWGDGIIEGDDVPQLLRIDAEGVVRWAIDLPTDGEPVNQRPKHVIADGTGGTWAFGEAEGGPWAARHDDEGSELDRLDCLGNATGWIELAAVGPSGELALGMLAFTMPPSHGSTAAWIAIVQDGVVSRALTFETGNLAASTLAVAWRNDGALVAGWTEWFDVGAANHVHVLAP
jgi:hypothetical protein